MGAGASVCDSVGEYFNLPPADFEHLALCNVYCNEKDNQVLVLLGEFHSAHQFTLSSRGKGLLKREKGLEHEKLLELCINVFMKTGKFQHFYSIMEEDYEEQQRFSERTAALAAKTLHGGDKEDELPALGAEQVLSSPEPTAITGAHWYIANRMRGLQDRYPQKSIRSYSFDIRDLLGLFARYPDPLMRNLIKYGVDFMTPNSLIAQQLILTVFTEHSFFVNRVKMFGNLPLFTSFLQSLWAKLPASEWKDELLAFAVTAIRDLQQRIGNSVEAVERLTDAYVKRAKVEQISPAILLRQYLSETDLHINDMSNLFARMADLSALPRLLSLPRNTLAFSVVGADHAWYWNRLMTTMPSSPWKLVLSSAPLNESSCRFPDKKNSVAHFYGEMKHARGKRLIPEQSTIQAPYFLPEEDLALYREMT